MWEIISTALFFCLAFIAKSHYRLKRRQTAILILGEFPQSDAALRKPRFKIATITENLVGIPCCAFKNYFIQGIVVFAVQYNPKVNLKKILVVDDEEEILYTLKTKLTVQGYEVVTTMSCDLRLEIFYSFKPDIVFLDVNVGNSDGRLMCRTIKTQAEYQHIPVILGVNGETRRLRRYRNNKKAIRTINPWRSDLFVLNFIIYYLHHRKGRPVGLQRTTGSIPDERRVENPGS